MRTIPLDAVPAMSGSSSVSSRTGEVGDEALLQRFVRHGDQAAFAALVHRHGPMVLGVCQRVLQDRHEADDAFQATFLLLVQRAASLREPGLLAGWLYGVAYRIALKERLRASRRGQHERERPPMPAAGDPLDAVASRELRDLLDAALNELPDKYRAALVLCYLEGKTNIEAARQLGWPIGSMSARLARGREMLRDRLSRRHPALSSSPLPLLLLGFLKPAAVGSKLMAETVRAAVQWVGQSAAGAATEAAAHGASVPAAAASARWPLSMILLVIAVLGLGGGLLAAEWFSSNNTTEPSLPPERSIAVPEPPAPGITPQPCSRSWK